MSRNQTHIIGIDPGFEGAIAACDLRLGFIQIYDMPVIPAKDGRTRINHHELLQLLGQYPGADVWLEEIAARPGQGVTSMFRFGQGYGAVEMACAAVGLPLRYVSPARWKRHFGLLGSAKDASRGIACQRFPTASACFARKKDAGRADAALIALYGREIATT